MYVPVIYFGQCPTYTLSTPSHASFALVVPLVRAFLLLRPGMMPLSREKASFGNCSSSWLCRMVAEKYYIPFMLFVSIDSVTLFTLFDWRGDLKSGG